MSSANPLFRRVLVANRGEIAIRICRTLAEMRIGSVAVFSDTDRVAPHRFAADLAIPIGGTTAAESYLDIDAILAAARNSGVQAIHPGYGFLSENPRFATAVQEAGLVFIGPDATAMERLGSKAGARQVAHSAGVPVVPGFDGHLDGDAAWLDKAREIGFPLMIKSSAGGGGKGMRMVERDGEFLEALAAGRREAKASFGDDRMILERRVFPARHVEVQILGDAHGRVVSLHERECSVQRRHQKVLEEAPSPALDEDLRARMGAAAVRLGEAVGYRNAGTVEFLLDEKGGYFFLEVNTRLQVEHPVTECVTGLDLVRLQIAIAAGEPLDELLAGRDLTPRGWAIEARIYAEAPEQGFLPAAGRLSRVVEPEGPGVRVDSGVRDGTEVSVHYDPMLAKLVVHAPDRAAACARLARALRDSTYLGIPTNVDFLRRVVEDPRFVGAQLRTDFLDLAPELVAPTEDAVGDAVYVAAALSSMFGEHTGSGIVAPGSGVASVFQAIGAFRVFAGDE